MAATIGLLTINSFVCAMWADALYNIRYVSDFESFRNFHLWDFLLFQTKGLAALQAGKVYVLAFFMVLVIFGIFMATMIFFATCSMLLTDTIFMLSTTIVDDVQHLFVCKERQGAEDCTTIDGGQQRLKVAQRKGKIELR